MIPKNTAKIILFLLKNVSKIGFNINQISKINNISVGSSFKILKELEKDNFVLKKDISNGSYFRLNYANQETIKLCELLLLSEKRNLSGYAKLYADELLDFEFADMIVLFGSVLKNKSFNDIDVLFVSSQNKKIVNFCLEISKVKSKPVVPLILKKDDLVNELNNKKKSILEIIKTGIILKGENVLLEVLENVSI